MDWVYPRDPVLRHWAERLERTGWATFVIDADYNVVWISPELAHFFGETDPTKLALGKHLAEAFLTEAWSAKMPFEDQVRLFNEAMPYVLGDEAKKQRVMQALDDRFRPLVAQLEPKPMPQVWSSWFSWKEADLPPYRVDIAGTVIHNEIGTLVGAWFVMFMGVKPSLLVLLALGDQSMYERMANLIEPRRRQAAVLFADLESSATLSRQLPTSTYFHLIREMTTRIDEIVGRNQGITGKHVGDGASAYFLADDLGSTSAAAAAAIATGRALRDAIADIDIPTAAEVGSFVLNVGIHWAAGLYMGQLVPGGRLDVTAIGDEVNECARIQETARGGALIASKSLLEQLTYEDAASLGIDIEKITYRPLADLSEATEKAVRDAGAIAVTPL
jgi:class 3 adenylate cyclase